MELTRRILLACLFGGVGLHAQSAPAGLSFNPSADHHSEVVAAYRIYVLQGGQALRAREIGKPEPDAWGAITYIEPAMFAGLVPGAYEVAVTAYGPGGESVINERAPFVIGSGPVDPLDRAPGVPSPSLPTMPAGGCTTVQPGPGWTCSAGGWYPPGMSLPGGAAPAVPPTSPPSMPTGGCTTVQPGPGWTCSAGGWYPPGMSLPGGAAPAVPPTSPSMPTGGCTTVKPGPGWTCSAGGWYPPGMSLPGGAAPAVPPTSPPPMPTGGCTTVQPGPAWTCYAGGWYPPGMSGPRGAAPAVAAPPPPSSGCPTVWPGPGWTCLNGGWYPPGAAMPGAALQVAAAAAVPVAGCVTVRPGPDWTCVGGNWYPRNHSVASSLHVEAEAFDAGQPGGAYYDVSLGNAGGAFRSSDVDLEATTDTGGQYNVGWMAAGEWLNYTVHVPVAGTYELQLRVASKGPGGVFHIEVDGGDRTGLLAIPDTGGWQVWTTLRKTVQLQAGTQVWRFVVDTQNPETGAAGNLNWIRAIPR